RALPDPEGYRRRGARGDRARTLVFTDRPKRIPGETNLCRPGQERVEDARNRAYGAGTHTRQSIDRARSIGPCQGRRRGEACAHQPKICACRGSGEKCRPQADASAWPRQETAAMRGAAFDGSTLNTSSRVQRAISLPVANHTPSAFFMCWMMLRSVLARPGRPEME